MLDSAGDRRSHDGLLLLHPMRGSRHAPRSQRRRHATPDSQHQGRSGRWARLYQCKTHLYSKRCCSHTAECRTSRSISARGGGTDVKRRRPGQAIVISAKPRITTAFGASGKSLACPTISSSGASAPSMIGIFRINGINSFKTFRSASAIQEKGV